MKKKIMLPAALILILIPSILYLLFSKKEETNKNKTNEPH